MTKKFALSFVVLVFLALAIPASAQYGGYIPQTLEGMYYRIRGNNVQMLIADNLGLVNGLTNQLRRAGYRSVAEDWVFNGAAYGINTSSGFYPMYDRNRQPLSRRQRIERGAGIVMAADGIRRIINNPRGTAGWIEAAVGAVFVNDSRYQPKNQRDNGTIVTPPEEESSARPPVYWSNGAPVAVGTRPGAASPFWGPGGLNCMGQGMATLNNQSAGPLRVFRSGQPFEILFPREQKCAPLVGDYTGEVVGTVVGSDGLTGRITTAPAKPQSLPGLVLVWR